MLKNQKGLTLIELLVTLGLIIFVIGVINQVYMTQSQSFKITEEKSKLTKEAKEIQNIITNIAMESSGIEEIKINETSYLEHDEIPLASNIEELVLQLSESTEFIYDQEDHTLSLGDTSLSDKVTGFSVSSLSGTYEETKAINIKISLQSKRLRKTIDYDTEFTVTFRNK